MVTIERKQNTGEGRGEIRDKRRLAVRVGAGRCHGETLNAVDVKEQRPDRNGVSEAGRRGARMAKSEQRTTEQKGEKRSQLEQPRKTGGEKKGRKRGCVGDSGDFSKLELRSPQMPPPSPPGLDDHRHKQTGDRAGSGRGGAKGRARL